MEAYKVIRRPKYGDGRSSRERVKSGLLRSCGPLLRNASAIPCLGDGLSHQSVHGVSPFSLLSPIAPPSLHLSLLLFLPFNFSGIYMTHIYTFKVACVTFKQIYTLHTNTRERVVDHMMVQALGLSSLKAEVYLTSKELARASGATRGSARALRT